MKKILLACLLISAYAPVVYSMEDTKEKSSLSKEVVPNKLNGSLKLTGATLLALGAGYGVKNIIDELRGKVSEEVTDEGVVLVRKPINPFSVAAWSAVSVVAVAACYKLGTSGLSDFTGTLPDGK